MLMILLISFIISNKRSFDLTLFTGFAICLTNSISLTETIAMSFFLRIAISESTINPFIRPYRSSD